MKLEKPINTNINIEYLQKVWSGAFTDFISNSDEKYYYWDDLKYRKDVPFDTPAEN